MFYQIAHDSIDAFKETREIKKNISKGIAENPKADYYL